MLAPAIYSPRPLPLGCREAGEPSFGGIKKAGHIAGRGATLKARTQVEAAEQQRIKLHPLALD